ncbi:IS982 family transposase [Candidatus Acetothermia bacterium]|nr:IS982 family transposase [Candidatus Acetothermia bacterium]
MPHYTTAIYCLCDEFVKAFGIQDDPQAQMSTAEVMTTALVAASFFAGNLEKSRAFLKDHGYLPTMLSKSRLTRRLHAIPPQWWMSLFQILAQIHKQANPTAEYIIDSCPVPVCDNIRIRRCRLYREEQYRGYIASKRRYFFGLRVHLLVTAQGKPVEFVLAPGAAADGPVLKGFDLDLPEGTVIYADKLHNDYQWEDFLKEAAGLEFQPLRKKNSHRAVEPWVKFWCQRTRKRIETSFSQLTGLFPKSIHAVTARGFELKLVWFILAFAIHSL